MLDSMKDLGFRVYMDNWGQRLLEFTYNEYRKWKSEKLWTF